MTRMILVTAGAFLAFAGPLLAGGPTIIDTDPVPEVIPAPASGVDWSGPYAGLNYGRASSTLDLPAFGEFDYDDGRVTGAFLGYNLQRGNLVYGGELSYGTVAGMVLNDPDLGGDDTVDSLVGLRGRVGYTLGNALIYGAVGLSKSSITFNRVFKPTVSGTSFALGMDYQFTDQIFVGLDYSRLKLDGTNVDPNNAFEIIAPMSVVSLRVGLSF
jgi:outer membrane immunogenic protein